MRSLIILFSLIEFICAGDSNGQGKLTNFLNFGRTVECEGKDSSNYTYVDVFSYLLSPNCQEFLGQYTESEYLIADNGNGKSVINLQVLAEAGNTLAGGFSLFEIMYLCTSGPLEGKYVYIHETGLNETFLKKCSSPLGYSYVSTKITLLIADKLDISMFVYPGGVFIPFKKAASTICTGYTNIV